MVTAREDHGRQAAPADGSRLAAAGLLIDDMCNRIQQWVLTATELLADGPVPVFLREACPRCGSHTAYRHDSAGEQVRGPALRVSENGCTCSSCGAFWGPERFHFLAALLGCDPLPA